jgi:hypothetical protein
MDNLEPVIRLSRDLRNAANTMSDAEARFLVDAYYQMQEDRIRDDGQIRSMSEEPHAVLAYLSAQHTTLENQIRGALDRYSMSRPIGIWLRQHKGIGPVIAAGLMAHIDIHKAQTVSNIWRYAGLDPTSKWDKGQKRPWNASLKTLCWKIGESFVKVSGMKDAYYGELYVLAKEREIKRNEEGGNAAAAAAILEAKKWKGDTIAKAAYESGKLPPAHVHARAKRWVVKQFLSDFHKQWRELESLPVADPYPIAHMNHAHLRTGT